MNINVNTDYGLNKGKSPRFVTGISRRGKLLLYCLPLILLCLLININAYADTNAIIKLDRALRASGKGYSAQPTYVKQTTAKGLEDRVKVKDIEDKSYLNCAQWSVYTKQKAEGLGLKAVYSFSKSHVSVVISDNHKTYHYSNGKRK